MKGAMLALVAAAIATPALADFNDKKPITATVTGATPTFQFLAPAPSSTTSPAISRPGKGDAPGGGG